MNISTSKSIHYFGSGLLRNFNQPGGSENACLSHGYDVTSKILTHATSRPKRQSRQTQKVATSLPRKASEGFRTEPGSDHQPPGTMATPTGGERDASTPALARPSARPHARTTPRSIPGERLPSSTRLSEAAVVSTPSEARTGPSFLPPPLPSPRPHALRQGAKPFGAHVARETVVEPQDLTGTARITYLMQYPGLLLAGRRRVGQGCLSVCWSVYVILSVCLSLSCMFACLSVCQFVYHFCLFVCLSVYLFSVCLPVCLSVFLSVYQSV